MATFSITALPFPSGVVASSAYSVSDSGGVVGNILLPAGNPLLPAPTHAYFWNNSASTDLFASTPGLSGEATSINADGEIVGMVNGAGPNQSAFAYQAGSLSLLPTPGGETGANAINDNSQIVGYYTTYADSTNLAGQTVEVPTEHPLLWRNGLAAPLPENSDGNGNAVAINANGDVLIDSYDSDLHAHVSIYNGEIMLPLNSAGLSAFGFAINDSDHVAGNLRTNSGQVVPFLYSDGALNLLTLMPNATSAGAFSLNDADVVVGSTLLGSGQESATLWKNGNVYDLNALIPSSPGWALEEAWSINDSGEIVGTGTYNGQPEAFLLTPTDPTSIPEPAAILLAPGFCLLSSFRRRRKSVRQ